MYRLTDVELDSGDTMEYVYDGIGRRIERIFTTTIDDNPDVTTYKYHYIGSQITDIEIDATNDGTPYKDEEMLFHMGANSQPISLTWKKYNYQSEQTTSATYYYHFDVHGNTLNLTDSSGTVKATYAYDTLGKMTYYEGGIT